ncbi:MAG: bifunctional phosphoribosylaminoimidazolecarboxamide formyltransferase/IMP cyclohydrolase PurH [Deltaproteobacteria bacterium]|nr:bifunctional phosphoribosylaminoimidazolecarboxamide formyltransferase/IMP cyclohydrolase PurH [Deltaproteobacteria bacterium]
MLIPIRRVLLSVTDKTDLIPLARALARHGAELISTGGTRAVLAEAGLTVREISEITGKPEAFGGRMKTLSFEVASALLFDRDRDAAEAAKLGIEPIDCVVVNLYPFEKKRDEGVSDEILVENIDIGGPTLLRAAAKNHRYVTVLSDPSQYAAVISELGASGGSTSLSTRARLARAAYNRTADYDSAVAMELDRRAGTRSLRLSYGDPLQLRYGENSHQSATLFRQRGVDKSLCDMVVMGGKQLSYNNLVDLEAALGAVKDLTRPGVAIVKHTNPCGLAAADSARHAFELAWAGDPVSAFGAVIAFNRRVELDVVRFLDFDAEPPPLRRQDASATATQLKSLRKFVEILAAPEFSPEAVEYLHKHKDLRIVVIDPKKVAATRDLRFLTGAVLDQDADVELLARSEVVTRVAPKETDEELVRFGLAAVRSVKSNAIVLVRRKDGAFQLVGMGSGQPNRLNSVRLAVEKARENLRQEGRTDEGVFEEIGRALMVSDAFFPFPDGIEVAAEAGVRCVYQPGGSIRDKAVIERCDQLGVVMVFTGLRHFKH